MPQVSGMDMLEFLRMKPDLIDLPVVMLSSEYTDIQVDEAFELGADAFVLKPATLDEIESGIEKAFAAAQKRLGKKNQVVQGIIKPNTAVFTDFFAIFIQCLCATKRICSSSS